MTMKEAKGNKVHQATMTKREGQFLYLFVYTSPPASVGLSNTMNKVIDRLEDEGYIMSEDGQSVQATMAPDEIEMEFSKTELNAIRYALALRVRPGQNTTVSIGQQRQIIFPLAKALGIFRKLKEDALGKKEKDDEELKNFKLDSEYTESEKDKQDEEEKGGEDISSDVKDNKEGEVL